MLISRKRVYILYTHFIYSMKLNEYIKKKNFLVCVDSDGCAIDSMDIKHIRSFGPCMVVEWGLQEWKEEILSPERSTHPSPP